MRSFISILLILIVFAGGCVGQKPPGCKEDARICPDGSVVARVPPDCGFEPCPSPPASPEATMLQPTLTPGKILPSSRLLSWAKEEGVRIGGISSSTIIKGNEYWMYYTGRGIELAKSSGGLSFAYVGTVIDAKGVDGADMVTNPSVFETKDGRYRMIFEASKMFHDKNDRKLYSAVSPDGLSWTVEEGVRFQDVGDGKPGELFTSVPDVIRLDDGRLRMYYTRGATSATALSNDEGLTWAKETDLKLRKVAIDPDIMILDDGTHKLFFTTFADEFGVGEQWVTSASSLDGVNFSLDEKKLINPVTPGGLITDPDVIKIGNGYRMYYGEFRKGEHGLYESESYIMSAFSSG